MSHVGRLCALGLLFLSIAALPAAAQYPVPLATFTGTVHAMDGKTLTVEDAESKTLPFFCTHKTRYFDGSKRIKASAIKPGDRVSVESKPARDGELEAVNVRRERPKSPQ
ncbi:MAG TPA: DUF5666 domain-containing protein [Bryobacteraceae bacterium]|jgi:hypothetical protein|nr:DUF5666 domain-containing protein [Bryobacteraceae bacterium]